MFLKHTLLIITGCLNTLDLDPESSLLQSASLVNKLKCPGKPQQGILSEAFSFYWLTTF